MAEDWTPKDNWSPNNHNHDTVYSKLGHVHDYAASDHNHDDRYSKLDHGHDDYVTMGDIDYVVERGTVTTVSGDDNQISCEVHYELWKSGWLVQSGLLKSASNAVSRMLYFAKEYRDTEYSIVATKIRPGKAHNTWHPTDGIGVTANTTNSCSISSTDDGIAEIMIGWVARGYAAV